MAQINPNIPIIGDPVATEEPKVKTALEDLVAAINALDDANIASNANINGSKLLNASVSAAKIVAGILPPTGSILQYAGSSAPTGYLMCDGSPVNRTGPYAALFTAIGTAYGVGDGSTTFNLPDLQGRVPVGKGDHSDVSALGNSDSTTLNQRRPAHSHTTTTDGAHTHSGSTNSAGAHTHGIYSPWLSSGFTSYAALTSGVSNTFQNITGSKPTHSIMASGGSHDHTISLSGGGHSHTVGSTGGTADAPSFVVVNYIIKI